MQYKKLVDQKGEQMGLQNQQRDNRRKLNDLFDKNWEQYSKELYEDETLVDNSKEIFKSTFSKLWDEVNDKEEK